MPPEKNIGKVTYSMMPLLPHRSRRDSGYAHRMVSTRFTAVPRNSMPSELR